MGLKDAFWSLVTPEGVPITFHLADPIERGVAFLFDLAILTIVTMVVGLIALVVIGAGLTIGVGVEESVALLVLAVFAVRQGYFAFFEIHWHGATPAKRLLGMRVVSRDGAGLTTTSIIARNLTRDVEVFLPMAVLIGPESVVGPAPWWLWLPASGWMLLFALLPLISKERTRAGDIIAGTLVVKVPTTELLDDVAARSVLAEIHFTREQLSFYGERELETLADILQKASLDRVKRSDLRKVSGTIAKKIGFSGNEPETNPRAFLRAFYKQQRAELERRLLYGQRIASKHARRR